MIGLIPVGAVAGQGLLIKEIIRNTPAERAGLRPGDPSSTTCAQRSP